MSARTVSKLILKDWHLHRIAILSTVGGSVLAILLVFLPGGGLVNMGASLAIAMLVTVTFYLPLASVLEERHDKTLTFLMGLPISPSEYVASKILGNLTIFLFPWLTLVAGVTLLPAAEVSRSLGSGFVPVVLLGIVLIFSIVLGFSLITESGGWTVALIVTLLFLTSNVVTEVIPDTPAVRETIQSIASRGSAFWSALTIEGFLIVLVLAATFFAQSRKRDFL